MTPFLLSPKTRKNANLIQMKESLPTATPAAKIEAEFLKAYEEHSDALFRHCMIRIRDRELAKDITQEAFSKTWLYLSQGKKIDYLRAFLFRVANNLIVDSSRRKKSSSLESMMEDDGFEAADETTKDPHEIGDARAAMKMLDGLDEIYRIAITMRFVDGLSPKEIARTLKVSENVVSVRIYRGIERLKLLTEQSPGRG